MKTNQSNHLKKEYDVIIIGGGVTGAGIARDCAKRGLRAILLERSDVATGASGRNHGLLHSGARYAVKDEESARECISENVILKRIASNCIDDTGGLFITLPEDDLHYQAAFVEACAKTGIPAEVISPKDALRLEPSVNPAITGAVKVPDGSIDPFRLITANLMDASMHGCDVLTYHEVVGVLRNQEKIEGVTVYNPVKNEKFEIRGRVTVNAAGIWGQHLCDFAGVEVNMFPSKGSLLIFGHRVNNVVLNRCRQPSDADILVPGDTVTVIGTTSVRIPIEEADRSHITPEEFDILIREGEKLAPALRETRILRAYAGVRPLVASDNDPSGRNISRGIVLLDHARRDGLEGFITITGGKLMTYRLMAEQTTDMICRKLAVEAVCTTARDILPGSEQGQRAKKGTSWHVPATIKETARYRHGTLASRINLASSSGKALVCECEEVTVGEIDYAIRHLHANTLTDLRRRTRLGMGTCQSELCACRAAAIMKKAKNLTVDEAKADLVSFLDERWRGIYPVGWGEGLRESELSSWVYQHMCGLT